MPEITGRITTQFATRTHTHTHTRARASTRGESGSVLDACLTTTQRLLTTDSCSADDADGNDAAAGVGAQEEGARDGGGGKQAAGGESEDSVKYLIGVREDEVVAESTGCRITTPSLCGGGGGGREHYICLRAVSVSSAPAAVCCAGRDSVTRRAGKGGLEDAVEKGGLGDAVGCWRGRATKSQEEMSEEQECMVM